MTPKTATDPELVRVIGLSNEVPAGDTVRRVLSLPFGRHPHPDGYDQDINPAAAGKMVAAIRRGLASGKDALPIFNSHPDLGSAAPADPSAYGTIVDAAVGRNAVSFVCDLTRDGIALVRGGKKFFSPHWLARVAGNVVHPFEVLSIGLTDRPVIPVAAIANAKSARGGQEGVPMRDKLIAMCKKHGVECPADAGDDQVVAALEPALSRIVALANEVSAEKAKVTNLEGTVATLTAEVAAQKTKVTEGVTALANERKERTTILLDVALADGRVPPAARKRWEEKLAADFPATVVELANARPEMKVTALANDLARRNAGPGNDKIEKQMAKVAAIQAQHKCTNADAWALAASESPELFS